MYVAVKGGQKAIENAHRWLDEERRGDRQVPEVGVEQIEQQLSLAVNRVMNEGSCYDPELAALAIKQARGDLIEAAFLLRAYRTTLPRFGYSEPIRSDEMALDRRISAVFKDLPGGQMLGPTFDYTHRLLDFALLAEGGDEVEAPKSSPESDPALRLSDILIDDDLLQKEPEDRGEVGDLTREPLLFPASREERLQNLARGDEGFLLALGYSTQRGFGRTHPFVGELRVGHVAVEFEPEELGFAIDLGDIEVTECQTVNQFEGEGEVPPQFTRGYGLTFGHSERKAIAMALVDRSLRAKETGGEAGSPAEDEEFVLYHSDNVQATGFVEHLKLPHYVDFQGELENLRRLRAQRSTDANDEQPT